MKTIKRKIEREDVTDAVLFAALGAIVITSLEFLFTTSIIHYISIPIIIAEAAAAVVAGALISLVAVKATDDED